MTIVVRVGCVVLGLLVAAGCGEAADPAAAPSTRSPSASVKPSPSPTPKPTVSYDPRYAACADGACEVALTGATKIKVLDGTLTVRSLVAGKQVDLLITFPSGSSVEGTFVNDCGGTLFASRRSTEGGIVGCPVGGPPQPAGGETAVQMRGWSTKAARVLVTSG
jgi:hypothetical protein